MVDKWHIYLLGLITISFSNYLTGASGVKEIDVFCSDGVNVTLPCNDVHPDCRSTHWFYRKENKPTGVQLFIKGIKTMDYERLSLGSDCSLNIYKTTKEDHGLYICRQQIHTNDPYTDVNVYLHVLHVSLSSTQTEIQAGRSVTLSCQLYSIDGDDCEGLLYNDRFQMIWVNESDVNLQSDSRYQISSSTKHCNSSLTTTLLNEDNNRELRCQIIKGTEVKTSDRYTVKYLGNPPSIKYEIGSIIRVIIIIVEFAVMTAPTVILLLIICERRSGKRRAQSKRLSYVNGSESVVISDC
ncbi:uncharacterized protein [Misgurnus anguillicaudatus]|uniref:uncharacterized protein n=1 Tax=Misgurnus anguillicaudatus TaxID=75329 RepID=UPI003CCF581A